MTAAGPDLDLDAIPLTPAQRDALAIDRHVVVSAGAGSGKTHTLAWRYVRLLLVYARQGGDDVEAVVVLTFTEKAAEEMASRCYARLLLVAPHLRELDPECGARIDRMIDRFDQARIGTFHSFCARILREFPTAAGRPGDLEILEGSEGVGLKRGAAEDAVLSWARASEPLLGELLDALGSRRALVAAVLVALEHHAEIGESLDAHRRGAIALDLGAVAQHTEDGRRWLMDTGLKVLAVIERLSRQGGTRFHARLEAIDKTVGADPLAVHRQLRDVLAVLVTERGVRTLSHHSVLGSRAAWSDPRRYGQAKAALAALQEQCADWPERYEAAKELPTTADARLLQLLPAFARLVKEALLSHTERLTQRRAMDFDGLQDGAVAAVLSNDALRKNLRARHRWLMVDEFQDTDERQWAMVRALGDAEAGEAADRVFLVGDVKQAIYGFRGGEVRLFAEAAAHLEVAPIVLPENFRSTPALIDWFNVMFPRLLPQDYAPMVAARPAAEGRVTWIDAKGAEEQASAVTLWIEARLATLDRGDPIAILLRTRTHLGVWEKALRRSGISYRVGQGVGFWERLEIRDAVTVIHAAATNDRLSVVGALRVPWLGGSEADVADHALHGSRHPALEELANLREERHTEPPTAWVNQLFAHFNARSWWGAEARANIEQLLDTIKGWENAGVPLLKIATRLVNRVVDVPRETEATPGADQARVVVLTIHASKGLEFPVVVVPELEKSPSGRAPALALGTLDGRLQLAFRVDDPDAEIQTHTHPALLTRLHAAQRGRDHDEYRRLLYVALTRARDELVLVGPADDAPPRSWAGLLADPPSSTLQVGSNDLSRGETASGELLPRWEDPHLEPVPMARRVEVSASDLVSFERCAARWFRSRVLGLPEPGALTRSREIAGLRGSVMHGLLEDRAHHDPAIASRRWAQVSTTHALETTEAQQGFATLERHRRALVESGGVQALLDAPGFDELAVRTPFEHGVFIGRVDRLFLDAERGGFVVLDYKTESLRGTTAEEAAAKHTTQLLAYAWAADQVLRAREQPPVVGAEILFTDGAHAIRVGPWAPEDLEQIPRRLSAVAAIESLPSAMARAESQRPACGTCGFLGRGCTGVGAEQPALF